MGVVGHPQSSPRSHPRRRTELERSRRVKQLCKFVAVNVLVFGFLLSLGDVLAISAVKIYDRVKPEQYAQSHLLPNYRKVDWARTHFAEYDNLPKGYYESFYGWRRSEFHGQTINIDANGLRRTVRPQGTEPDKVIAFFGGSTIWGTGANDATTIPSFFAHFNPQFEAINFGETGYIAHQSLNLFMRKYFEGFRPDVVVFYDGVNDVWNKCRRESDDFSHSREYLIRTLLQENSAENSYWSVIQPLKIFLDKAKRTLENLQHAQSSHYDCTEDAHKAELIARVLLSDWMIVKQLVESYGGTFIAVLQPQAYGSKSRLDHLELNDELGRQYRVLYPLIVALLDREFAALKDNFVDLRAALDQEDYFYIDWCHLSPNGNEIIARQISDAVAKRTAQTTARR